MKKVILIIFSVIFVLTIFPVVEAKTFNDLTNYQKQKYWTYIKDCSPLLLNKEYSKYRTCALEAFEKASQEKESNAWCTDSDGGKDYLTKGIVKTDIYPQGKEDYVQTFPNGNTYLMEGFCSSKNQYAYAQKKCSDFGKKYFAKDGACVYINQPPVLADIGNKEINEEELLTFSVFATDTDNDILTYSAEGLPTGASFENKVFSWTPSYEQAGTYEVTFKVSDGELVATQTVIINIADIHGWLPMSTVGAPLGVYWSSAVWTGDEMIVFGGYNVPIGTVNTGGRYNPKTNTWKSMNIVGAPLPQQQSKMVWTGEDVILWGIVSDGAGGFQNSGMRYNPKVDLWNPISTVNAPFAGGSVVIWTGNEMIVWGGGNNDGPLNIGGIYNPQTDSWTSISTVNAPKARAGHSAIWTGDKMIVWGGEDGCTGTLPNVCNSFNDGGIYDPVTDQWTSIAVDNNMTPRAVFNAVWTGKEMIVWGGYKYIGPGGTSIALNDGGSFNLLTEQWTPISNVNAPSKRHDNPAVWTGEEMLIWGGYNFPWDNTYTNTGGAYNPVTDSWTTMPLNNAPTARKAHVAVWTGDQMIIWGGWDGASSLNTGGRYIP